MLLTKYSRKLDALKQNLIRNVYTVQCSMLFETLHTLFQRNYFQGPSLSSQAATVCINPKRFQTTAASGATTATILPKKRTIVFFVFFWFCKVKRVCIFFCAATIWQVDKGKADRLAIFGRYIAENVPKYVQKVQVNWIKFNLQK